MTILKVDITNEAYEHLRIRGVVTDPTPEEDALALRLLENMANLWLSRDIRVGYAFEDVPDANTETGFDNLYKSAFSLNLAVNLIPAFNKPVPPDLYRLAHGALSSLSSSVFRPKRTNWPTRHPVGSGNDWINRWRKFYPATCDTPDYPQTTMRHEEQIFGMRWNTELRGETITGSTWVSDSTALEIVDDTVYGDDETQVKVRRVGNEYAEVLLTNTVNTAERTGLIARLVVCLV